MTDVKTLDHVYKSLQQKFKDKKLVLGEGFAEAKIVFVGEAPGPEEQEAGKPLAGSSMKLLNQLLKSAGINKNKVYFTNILKYSPTINKAPTSKELKSNASFLKEELKTIQPHVVVTMGNLALNGVGLRQPLDNVHGRTFNFGSYELLPTFHPEHALRDTAVKALLAADMAKLKEMIAKKA